MAVMTSNGDLYSTLDHKRVGGGPCAIVNRKNAQGTPIVHGTCILQKIAEVPTPIDPEHELRLVLPDGREARVRVVRQTMTSCGPEILRFEGPGSF